MAANLLIVPLAFCGLAAGIAASLFNLFVPAVAQFYAAATWFFLHGLIEIVEWGSRFRLASWEIYQFSTWQTVFYFTALLFIFNLRQARIRRWFLIYLLLLANVVVWQLTQTENKQLNITFLDVGQGDAVLLTFPDGRHALIDGGPRAVSYDAGKWVVEPHLKRKGIEEVHAVILSHADSDHLGGFPYLLRKFKVHEVWDNGQPKDTALYGEYLGLIDSLKIKRRILKAGDRLEDFAPVQIFVIHPTDRFLASGQTDVNDGSLSLRVSYGEIDFLLAGDVEKSGEQQISKFGELLDSEVLKVSHHGSRTSSTQAFLNFVRPELAVISVGELNKFDHPHPEVIERLQAMGVEILRTDRDAAVTLKTDGKQIRRINWK